MSKKKPTKKGAAIKARDAQRVVNALTDLSGNRMPVRKAVQLRRVTRAFREFVDPLDEEVQRLFRQHANGSQTLKGGSEALAAFNKEIEPLMAEEYEIVFEPINMAFLESLPEETTSVSPLSIDTLINHGVLVE